MISFLDLYALALCSVVNDFHSKPNPCQASAMELLVVIMIEVQNSTGYAA